MSRRIEGFSRREFFRLSALAGAGIALPLLLPDSLRSALAAQVTPRPRIGKPLDNTILVIIELGGGNDGLNTVIPYGNDDYYRARPTLGVKRDHLLPLNDSIGLHEKLKGVKRLYDDGRAAVVNGVGYPNPIRSHFRSMEIWRTATDSNKYEHEGWLGRYFDATTSGRHADPLLGVSVGPYLPVSFTCEKGAGVAFQNPGAYRWLQGSGGDSIAAFRKLNKTDADYEEDVKTLDFLRHTTEKLALSSDRVIKAARPRRGVEYPENRLGRDLKTVADLIAGGLPTRVYSVSYVGFDTHANQAPVQENLLEGFGDGVEAFLRDLKTAGVSDRVVVISYSEFGRRVHENSSHGTDHGTAGPMFVFGDPVDPGLHGRYPSLSDLDHGDLKYQVDFRSVYATMLHDWFRIDSAEVLHKSFPTLNLLKG